MGDKKRQQREGHSSEYEITGVLATGTGWPVGPRDQWPLDTKATEMIKVSWKPSWYETTVLDTRQRALLKDSDAVVLGPAVENGRDIHSSDALWLLQKKDRVVWMVNYGLLRQRFSNALLEYYEKRAELVHVEEAESDLESWIDDAPTLHKGYLSDDDLSGNEENLPLERLFARPPSAQPQSGLGDMAPKR
ncbi:unnamed protein product, partial [Mesorhabditis spiculigera]